HTRLVSDWSSDVCSSDLMAGHALGHAVETVIGVADRLDAEIGIVPGVIDLQPRQGAFRRQDCFGAVGPDDLRPSVPALEAAVERSEERRVGKGSRTRGSA